jgi:hypothetical protein
MAAARAESCGSVAANQGQNSARKFLAAGLRPRSRLDRATKHPATGLHFDRKATGESGLQPAVSSIKYYFVRY